MATYIFNDTHLQQVLHSFPTLVILSKSEPSDVDFHRAYVLRKPDLDSANISIDVSEDDYLVDTKLLQDDVLREADLILREHKFGLRNKRQTFYCLRDLRIPNLWTINKGFPVGMSPKSLKVGAIVNTCWNDSPPIQGIVIDVDSYPSNYVGDRTFRMLDCGGNIQRCVQTQLIELIDPAGVQNLLRTRQHVDALLEIQQLAQGQTNKTLRKVCDIADTALHG